DAVQKALVEAVRRYGLESACAIYHNGEYRLSLPAVLTEDRVFALSASGPVKGWFTDTGPRATAYVVHEGLLYAALWGQGKLVRFTDQALADEGELIPTDI